MQRWHGSRVWIKLPEVPLKKCRVSKGRVWLKVRLIWVSTLGPQVPMKNEGFVKPQHMGEITPKNEGNVGSHGNVKYTHLTWRGTLLANNYHYIQYIDIYYSRCYLEIRARIVARLDSLHIPCLLFCIQICPDLFGTIGLQRKLCSQNYCFQLTGIVIVLHMQYIYIYRFAGEKRFLLILMSLCSTC